MLLVNRVTKRYKKQKFECHHVSEKAIPFEVVEVIGKAFESEGLNGLEVKLPEAAKRLCRSCKGRKTTNLQYAFQTCSPVKVTSLSPRRCKKRNSSRGMLWFLFRLPNNRTLQFVGTIDMCRKRLLKGK